MLTLMLVKATFWALARVMIFSPPPLPTTNPPTTQFVQESAAPLNPFPLRFITCGPLLALLVRVTVPVCVPSALGVKVTFTVQAPPGLTGLVQVLLAAYSVLAATLLTFNGPVPVLLTVTDLTPLVVFST